MNTNRKWFLRLSKFRILKALIPYFTNDLEVDWYRIKTKLAIMYFECLNVISLQFLCKTSCVTIIKRGKKKHDIPLFDKDATLQYLLNSAQLLSKLQNA